MTNRLAAVAAAVLVCTAALAGCGKGWGGHCAASDDCFFTRDEWTLVSSLADVTKTPPPEDLSNRLLDPTAWKDVRGADTIADPDVPAAVRLGWRLYHDPRLSGDGFDAKDTLGRAAPTPRPFDPMKPQLRISCATCHDPAQHGGDVTSQPGNVSNGAGWYDVNGQQTLNVARFAPVFYWNGRTDSLWSQAAQVMESGVSMNSRREKTLWVVANCYAGDPDAKAVFTGAVADELVQARDLVKVTGPDVARTADFRKAFDDATKAHPELSPSLAARVHVDAAKAIAAYEWFLTSDRSRFDNYVAKGPASTLLTPSEKRGLKLFIGRAGCINCHNTSLFSDRQFHDVGVVQRGEHVPTVAACTTTACDCREPVAAADGGVTSDAGTSGPPGAGVGGACLAAGAYAGVQKLHASSMAMSPPSTTVFRRCTCYDDEYREANKTECMAGTAGELHGCEDQEAASYDDPGVAKPPTRWLGAWRTPSLRDVAVTGPYMHDGAYATLTDVVWHYDQGTAGEGWGQSELAPLFLSDQDRADIVAFLGTLTGVAGPPALVAKPDPSSYPPVCTGMMTTPDAGTDAGPRDAGAESAPSPDAAPDTSDAAAAQPADAADDGDGP